MTVAELVDGPRGRTMGIGRRTRWPWMGFAVLLFATSVLYLWRLGSAGYTNPFYAAAVQSSSRSGIAWLFGAVDAPGFITVDKPPADNWLMGLSARLFGFSSWSMLLPQALLGIGTVALLVLAVRRWAGWWAGLGAGLVLALTPVAVIMFRFDDPDALLTFLLVAAGYAMVRGVDEAPRRSSWWWLVLAGALVGLGFLTKMGAALLVLPAFAAVHLWAADVPVRRRIGQLAAGGGALVVSAGWYVALVAVWPASARPWIGGSPDNSLLQLAVGYNGVSRLVGRDRGPVGPGGPGVPGAPGGLGAAPGSGSHGPGGFGFGGPPGLGRLFSGEFGGQIAWLLPAALLVLVALGWVTRRAARRDRLRAALVLWGGWLLTGAAVFSLMAGTIHPYYTVLLAPAIAALLAVGAREAWRRRRHPGSRWLVAATVLGTGLWGAVLLHRTPAFLPWLTWVVAGAGLAAAAGLVVWPVLARRTGRSTRARLVGAVGVLVLALIGCLGGPSAYTLETVIHPRPGSQASAGPALAGRTAGGVGHGGVGHGGAGPGGGGPGRGAAVDPALSDQLRTAGTTWSAATPTTMAAAGLELASGTSVLGIGGFSGADPTPTLAQFQAQVAAGRIRYFIDRPDRAGWRRGRDQAVAPIRAWVGEHYPSTQLGGQTVYDLRAPRG